MGLEGRAVLEFGSEAAILGFVAMDIDVDDFFFGFGFVSDEVSSDLLLGMNECERHNSRRTNWIASRSQTELWSVSHSKITIQSQLQLQVRKKRVRDGPVCVHTNPSSRPTLPTYNHPPTPPTSALYRPSIIKTQT